MATITSADIELQWRSTGSGVCVIVEGETEREDAWFYKRWFSPQARTVTFFPQNGWEKVVAAVQTLRGTAGARKVYGIIDRDFEAPVYTPFPADGILRTRKYTLENYLLEPAIWFQLARPFVQRTSRPEWASEAAVRALIEDFYRQCIPVAAYNATIRAARQANLAVFGAVLPENERKYAHNLQTLAAWGDIPQRLRGIQTALGISLDLAADYASRQSALSNGPFAQLEETVTGKPVLTLLREKFPLRLSGAQAWDDLLGAYMHIAYAPPSDVNDLVTLILEDAHHEH